MIALVCLFLLVMKLNCRAVPAPEEGAAARRVLYFVLLSMSKIASRLTPQQSAWAAAGPRTGGGARTGRGHPADGGTVENNGFEPLTPCLQSRCSSQLS